MIRRQMKSFRHRLARLNKGARGRQHRVIRGLRRAARRAAREMRRFSRNAGHRARRNERAISRAQRNFRHDVNRRLASAVRRVKERSEVKMRQMAMRASAGRGPAPRGPAPRGPAPRGGGPAPRAAPPRAAPPRAAPPRAAPPRAAPPRAAPPRAAPAPGRRTKFLELSEDSDEDDEPEQQSEQQPEQQQQEQQQQEQDNSPAQEQEDAPASAPSPATQAPKKHRGAYAKGDTHMRTLDGCKYLQRLEGDFVMINAPTHKSLVQARFRHFGHGTVMIGLAFSTGDHVLELVGRDAVSPVHKPNQTKILFDGEVQTEVASILGNIKYKLIGDSRVDIDANGILVACKVHRKIGMLNCAFRAAPQYKNATSGLLGNFDGSACNTGLDSLNNYEIQNQTRIITNDSLFSDKDWQPNLQFLASAGPVFRSKAQLEKTEFVCSKAFEPATQDFRDCVYDLSVTHRIEFIAAQQDGLLAEAAALDKEEKEAGWNDVVV